jgi:glycosyltransferase involved in cell wall biosynthesis
MKIGFDAVRVFYNTTGLGNYARFVIGALAAARPDDDLHLYTPGYGSVAIPEEWGALRNIHVLLPRRGAGTVAARWVWRSCRLGRRAVMDGVRIYHGLSHELPRDIFGRGVATVVTMHDLIYLRYPEYFHPLDRAIYDYKYRRSARFADVIVAVSEQTKRDLVTMYGITADRIRVVGQGCSPIFANPVARSRVDAVRARYGLPERYVLQVGTIEPRKNLELSVRALALAPADDRWHLVAVGRARPYLDKVYQLADRLGVRDRLHVVRNAPLADMPPLYLGASVFVYPSRFEGFGIPMLEAITVGVPAVGAKGSCLEEAGGPGSAYVDPDDPEDLAHLIAEIRADRDRAARMIAAGHEHALRFAPERIAAELVAVYAEACRKQGFSLE